MSLGGLEVVQMNSLVIKNPNSAASAVSLDPVSNGNKQIDSNTHNRGATGEGGIKKKLRFIPFEKWQKIELVILAAVVVIVWGLLSLPVIFYHLPESQISNNNTTGESGMDSVLNSSVQYSSGSGSGSTSGNQMNAVCLTKYTGTHCLQSLHNCLPGKQNTSEIFISNLIDDQSLLEDGIETLLFSLEFLIRPSDECRKRVVPFLCLYTFGICDENSVDYRPKATECSDIRDNVCESEWQEANSALVSFGMPTLPDCSTFSDDGLVCSSDNLNQTDDTPCTIECHDHFYCEHNFCQPRCDKFRGYSDAYTVASDVMVIISACIGILSGCAVLVISCVRHKRMLTFPTVLIMYLTIALVVFAFTVLISFVIDRSTLYCTSINLLKSIKNPTAFCRISGGIFYYVLAQASLWWIFHVSILFWKVAFPFHSRTHKGTQRAKYIHVIMVLVALLLPLIPAITGEVVGGYTISRFPPILCTGSDADATFYTLMLPIIIIMGVGTSTLIFIFWKIHKQQGLFRVKMQKSPITMGTAERKILIVFLYYITLGVFALTAFTLATKHLDQNSIATFEYFECQKNGRDETCSYDAQQYPYISLISFLLFGLFPAINLVYAVNVQELKALAKKLKAGLLKKMSTAEYMSESTAVSIVPQKLNT